MFATYQRLGVNVWASDRQVIRVSRKKLNKGVLRDPRYRLRRHQFYRQMLSYHKHAQAICTQFRL